MPAETQSNWNVPAETAIPRLAEELGASLYALGRRICGNPEDAEDLVQETFLNAWRYWHQFRGNHPKAWLYTIAAHACQRMHRRRSGEPEHMASMEELLPFGDPSMAVTPDGGLDEQMRRESRELVGSAIAGLPVDYRMPLVLKEIVGFSVEQVGEILDLKPATVKTRLHRARLQVRHALESVLPKQSLPPAAYSKQICLDLLRAKQQALDTGTQFPRADEIICDRCIAVFKTMDVAQDICRELGNASDLPAALRELIVQPPPGNDGGAG